MLGASTSHIVTQDGSSKVPPAVFPSLRHTSRVDHAVAAAAPRVRADSLLGVASVPLTPLLHDCWVDGYAPVYALVVSQPPPGGAGASSQLAPAGQKVQVR